MMTGKMRLIGVAAALMIAQTAWGQAEGEAEAPGMTGGEGLRFELTPGVWFARLGGDVKLGPSGQAGSIQLKAQLDLRDSKAVFQPDLTVRKEDRWHLRASGFKFSTDAAGAFEGRSDFGSLSLANGDRYRASVDMWSLAAEWGAELVRPIKWSGNEQANRGTKLSFSPKVGVRHVDVDQDLEMPGVGRVDTGGEWTAVYGGLEMRLRWQEPDALPIGHAFELEAGGGIGPAFGGDGGFVWQVRVNATLEITPNVGVTFGYRLVELQVEDGEYEFNAGLQGLFAGAAIRF